MESEQPLLEQEGNNLTGRLLNLKAGLLHMRPLTVGTGQTVTEVVTKRNLES